jgi:hypothetical protein
VGNEFLNFVKEQGLPGWTVLVIGGGTIIAAVISVLGALAIAWVNAFAAVRLDREKALRDHRRAMSMVFATTSDDPGRSSVAVVRS